MVSLVDGVVPPLLLMLATAGLLAHLWPRPPGRYRTHLARGIAAACVTTILAIIVHKLPGLIADHEDEYPFRVNITVAIALTVLFTTIATRANARRWQRWISPISFVLLAALAGDQLAVHYGYPPDLRTLLGLDVQGAHRFNASDVAQSSITTTSSPSTQPVTSPTSATTLAMTPPITPPTAAPGTAATTTTTTRGDSAATSMATSTPGAPAVPAVAAVSATWRPPASVPANGDVVTDVAIPGAVSGFTARPAVVYLPPAYRSTSPPPKLPVVLLLAGVPGQPRNWTSGLDVHRVYDEFAAAHHGLAPILVMVDHTGSFTGDKGCVDSAEGRVETYLTVDVPAFVKATFGTADGPAAWGIAGFSDGGTCAAVLGLRHTDQFGFAADFSGDLGLNLDGSAQKYTTKFLGGTPDTYAAHDPVAILATGRTPKQFALWLEAGEHEPSKKKAAEAIAAAATAAGIRVELHESPAGSHTFSFWRQCVRDSVAWINAQVGIT